ncbi:hypothetical protein MNEG_2881 [Monoraphidium neglectum]|uniref:Uncharacterized protein n=1 Tax=Monoraphidium neglectum TaxID=145388 RepID=A0A0D2LEH9_9CHLO|nr:hypothetical protein MNEG_2881 [Monoraphidium neglectum]KIZ05074.1 hypothetical protein MNEG_2881 [Monoraphidium neglectum]|eukprot:XP_013904093.1 hypothetical protein MNEG_2881 [Monoraphidium neglectum]
MRVLFWKKWARTRVRQCADLSASGAAVTVTFELIQSDLMLKLEGSWAFTLQTPSKPGGWPLSRVQYRFCMWPKGVPSALRRLPGLMDAVQGAVARESGQMMDKLAFVEGKMAYPTMHILDAVCIAAAEVDSAGSYKKLAKRAAKASAAAAASKPRPQVPGGFAQARPQVAVLAHRLSFESQSSVDSLPSFDAVSSDGADDAPAAPRSPRARRGGSGDGSSGSGGSATSDEGGRGRDVFGSDCGSSDCDGDGGAGRDQRGRAADAGLRMAKKGPFVRPGDGLVSLS